MASVPPSGYATGVRVYEACVSARVCPCVCVNHVYACVRVCADVRVCVPGEM